MNTVHVDYLKTDELTSDNLREAMHNLKTDYLGFEETDKDIVWKAELLAYDEVLTTEYKDDYEVLDPVVDRNLIMPSAYPYVFVHFSPREDIENVKGQPKEKSKDKSSQTTYLVVVNWAHERVVYSGLYTPPKGDRFYRYNAIINEIENR